MPSSDLTTVLGAFVTVILAAFAIAKVMLKQASRDRDADRDERLLLAQAIGRMADSSSRIADEAKERNGFSSKQHVLIINLVKKVSDSINKG